MTKMNAKSRLIVLATALLLAIGSGNASLTKFVVRRQSGEVEKEVTTPRSQAQQDDRPPARLYPDLPRPSSGGGAGFNAPPPFGLSPFGSINQPPTPFVPFGPSGNQMPNRFADPRFQPRPVSSAERVNSQTFTSGLGRRLLAMVGIQTSENNNNNGSNETISVRSNDGAANEAGNTMMSPQDTLKALQNSTVLSQLNRGVQSIYGSLSKMYNETVQQQLGLLEEKFKKGAENSTNPWQQRMAQQVPQFFKNMAARVDGAQANLNKLWRDVTSANNGTLNWTMPNTNGPSRGLFGSFDHFLTDGGFGGGGQPGGGFFDQFGRQFGFAGGDSPSTRQMNPNEGQQEPGSGNTVNNFVNQLRFFWQDQVQPQIGMLKGQVTRVWRDLTSSGVFVPEPILRSRNGANGLGGSANGNANDTSSSDLVENILKEVDIGGSEYILIEPKSDDDRRPSPQQNMLSAQMQNSLMNMQRELNQLWMGLSRSLQNAVGSVRQTLNPRPQFGMMPMDASASDERKSEVDPAENEIDGKIKDLSKLQRDADVVYRAVQQQQVAQQQRPTITDRFRNYFGNLNFGELDQLPARVSDQATRFGGVVTDLWNQIPERWDSFINRQPTVDNLAQASPSSRLTSPRTTPAAAATTQKPSE